MGVVAAEDDRREGTLKLGINQALQRRGIVLLGWDSGRFAEVTGLLDVPYKLVVAHSVDHEVIRILIVESKISPKGHVQRPMTNLAKAGKRPTAWSCVL